MKRVIIVGSPRTSGRCAHLAEMLFEANIDERPEDELFLVPVSEIEVGPCIGCNACRTKTPIIFRDDDGNEVTEERYRCVFDDDTQTLYDLLDDADALSVVTPVYFSGVPGPMKCLLDRMQPYFWAYQADGPRLPKRPIDLHVVGEGGDPHGYDALVSEVRSALLLPGFKIERIFDWVGKIAPDGEIQAEATVAELGAADADNSANAADKAATAERKSRPKLDLSQGNKPAQTKNTQQRGKSARSSGGSQPDGRHKEAAKAKGSQGNQARKGGSNANGAKGKGKRRG